MQGDKIAKELEGTWRGLRLKAREVAWLGGLGVGGSRTPNNDLVLANTKNPKQGFTATYIVYIGGKSNKVLSSMYGSLYAL